MKYLSAKKFSRDAHPSIHYTGSVRGMKKAGLWGKHDKCVRWKPLYKARGLQWHDPATEKEAV